MHKIDLNVDLGESYGNYVIGSDADIIPLVSSVNVACGMHAGDPVVLSETLRLVKENKHVALGAHPGYPDLQGFGRRFMSMTPAEIESYVLYQLSAIEGMARVEGLELNHVKPHGALYNATFEDDEIAHVIAQSVYKFNPKLKLVGLSGGKLVHAGKEAGLRVVNEVFADRAYMYDGSLMPRHMEGSIIPGSEEAMNRVVKIVKKGIVESVSGKEINIKADSICIHGDGHNALEFVSQVRKALIENDIEITNKYAEK